MKFNYLAASVVAACSMIAATAGSAATVTPDTLIIESNQNRGDGSSTGDIVTADFGDITGLTAGWAGRIVNATDSVTFSTNNAFNVDFVNLTDLLGVDIDNCEGFDGSDCSVGSANNENGRLARFILDDGVNPALMIDFTSSVAAGTNIFSNVAAGNYTFTIDGISGAAGSAYDIAISAVPVPAAGLLLLGGLGGLAALRRRKQAA